MIERILVPTDGSVHARKAIELAGTIASSFNATIYLLHAVSKVDIPDEFFQYIEFERMDADPERVYLQKMGDRITEAAERELREKGVENVRAAVVHGDASQEIITFAREHHIDMIIMGNRGL